MVKVHHNSSTATTLEASTSTSTSSKEVSCLTVWNKSLLFNCRGFTVFDPNGDLLFRVDNYSAAYAFETLLMDAVGKPLLTIRRKGMAIGERWVVYNGGDAKGAAMVFRMKKKVGVFAKGRTEVKVEGRGGEWVYVVDGCYRKRSCEVSEREGDSKKVVAEVRRKEGVRGVKIGHDVFTLRVGPALDAKVAMAIVVVLEQMFGSSR